MIHTWHENLVLVLFVCVRENVRALQRLREETEDVIDDEDGGLGRAGSGDICLHAIDGLVVSLGRVALANDGRDSAAGVGLRHGC